METARQLTVAIHNSKVTDIRILVSILWRRRTSVDQLTLFVKFCAPLAARLPHSVN
jgi:hypothetical protein